jgi:hypothetical protein
MARLPIPGGDSGTWGYILNTFLEVSLNADGTIQPVALQQAGGVTTTQVGVPNGVATLDGSGSVPAGQLDNVTANVRYRGSWAPTTVYLENDVLVYDNALYIVETAFTSGAGFSTANLTQLSPQSDTYLNIVESVNDVPSSGSAQTIPDVTSSTIGFITLTSNCTLTFPVAAAGKTFQLALAQDSTGGRLVTWPSTVWWQSGIAPTLSTAPSLMDIFKFVCFDGSHWIGITEVQGISQFDPPSIVQFTHGGGGLEINSTTLSFDVAPTTGNMLVAFSLGTTNNSCSAPTGFTQQYETQPVDNSTLQSFAHTVGNSETNSYAFSWSNTEYNSVILVELTGVGSVDQAIASNSGSAFPSFTDNSYPNLVLVQIGQNTGSGLAASNGWTTLFNLTNNYHQNLVVYQSAYGVTLSGNALNGDSTNLPIGLISLSQNG